MVVVFGSINLDLIARVPTLPAPGETLVGSAFEALPGGKGANQALAARRAGAEVALFGAVGDDHFAAIALRGLEREGVDLQGLLRVATPTGVALIHVDARGENAITVVPGANRLARAARIPDSMPSPLNVVVAQLEVPIDEVLLLARRSRKRGSRMILNAAPVAALSPEMLASIDALVVNQTEAEVLAAALDAPGEAAAFAAMCNVRYGPTTIVTLGAEGAIAAFDRQTLSVRAPPIDVVDTIGAGDAFVGGFAAALDRGAPIPRALREGIATGTLACARAGAQAALPQKDAIAALADTL